MTQTGANAGNGWFNSSSISLTIPAGASVAYARLLWAGDTGVFKTGANTTVTSRCNSNNSPVAVQPPGAASSTPVQLTIGSKPKISVTAGRFTTDTIANVAVNQPQYYSAATDVTPSFAGVPTGSPLTITAANVWTPAGFGCMGGWSLVVVYAYPQADPTNAPTKREVFVYDGHVRQNSTDPATTTSITGFRVSGQAKVGVVAYEGDWGITGDQFSINGTAQTDPGGPGGSSTNFFTSFAQGTTPNTAPNNFSVDAKQFAVSPTVIQPGDTSASLSFSTSGDSYLAQELVMSVPVPTLQISKTAAPSTVHAGDTVTYTITVTNPVAGSTATNVKVTDPLTPSCNKTIGNLTGSTTYTCTATARHQQFHQRRERHRDGRPERRAVGLRPGRSDGAQPGDHHHQDHGSAGLPGRRDRDLHDHGQQHRRRRLVQRRGHRPDDRRLREDDRRSGGRSRPRATPARRPPRSPATATPPRSEAPTR